MKRIKLNDKVIVVAGKSKGHVGEVVKVLANKLIVKGANIMKKHVKPNPNVQEPGGIKEMEAPIHISNIALVNPVSGKADKVGFKFIDEDGQKKKVRYFKSDDEIVDVA
jgi:large subunit ribosomal protein L24